MATKNNHLSKFSDNSAFIQIYRKINSFQKKYPHKEIYRMGIGDTSQALRKTVIDAFHKAATELGCQETYTGYGDPVGNMKLREAICGNYYQPLGIDLDTSEIFVSDGAQSDSTNIQELFGLDNLVAVQNPMYPSFIEGNFLAGRSNIIYLQCLENTNFIPSLPSRKVDIIYLCFPNNPTGAIATKEQLKAFVDYAIEHQAVIIFDAVYSEFITMPNIPKSIYEVDGAKKCAIEINSFSKRAGFTGVRLGWSVIPQSLTVKNTVPGELNKMWKTRQSTKFWGASNLAQQGGIAALSPQGKKECKEIVQYYLENAGILRESLEFVGLKCFGGFNNPFIWVKTPCRMSSWDFFEQMLYQASILGTPGCLFGSCGEGYLRLSALGDRKYIQKALQNVHANLSIRWMELDKYIA